MSLVSTTPPTTPPRKHKTSFLSGIEASFPLPRCCDQFDPIFETDQIGAFQIRVGVGLPRGGEFGDGRHRRLLQRRRLSRVTKRVGGDRGGRREPPAILHRQ